MKQPKFKINDNVTFINPITNTEFKITKITIDENNIMYDLSWNSDYIFNVSENRLRLSSKFKIGDRVKVVKKVEHEAGWDDIWVYEMDKLIGKESVIVDIHHRGLGMLLTFDRSKVFWLPASSLELVQEKDEKNPLGFEEGKKYKMRNGKYATFYKVRDNHTYTTYTLLFNENEIYTTTGRVKHDVETEFDIVSNIPLKESDSFKNLPELFDSLIQGNELVYKDLSYKLSDDKKQILYKTLGSNSWSEYTANIFKAEPKLEWYETEFSPRFCYTGDTPEFANRKNPTSIRLITQYDKDFKYPFRNSGNVHKFAIPLTKDELLKYCHE